MSNTGHSGPNDHGANNLKRSVSGDVTISGEIAIEAGPKESLSRDAAEKKQDSKDHKKWWLEVVTIAVVTLYTFFAGWQSLTTAGQLKEARKIAEATDKDFRIEQRPLIRLAPDGSKIAITEGQPLEISITAADIGKTPARGVDIFVAVEKFSPTETPNLEFREGDPGIRITSGILYPSEILNFKAHWARSTSPGTSQPIIISQQDVEDWNAKRIYFAIHGTVIYADIFGKPHWTHLCQTLTATGETTHSKPCSDYNNVDSEQ
jgi:hypothetical protein